MARQWHYCKGEQRLGPITDKELQVLAQSGLLQPSDLVWTDGMAAWTPAQAVPDLTFAAAIPQRAAPQQTRNATTGRADFLPPAPSMPRYPVRKKKAKSGPRRMSTGGILNILFGIVFIGGGLSGVLVLRGTHSGHALAALGVGLLLLGLYRMVNTG